MSVFDTVAEDTPKRMDKTTRALKDRKWEEVQQKAFTGWLNEILAKRDLSVEDVVVGLESGVELINFLEVLLEKKLKQKWVRRPPTRIHKIQNLSMALDFLRAANVVRLTGIGAEDFVDHEKKMILGFLWTLYKHFRIDNISVGGKTSDVGLLLWAQQQTAGYRDVQLDDYVNSWGNGMGFLALVDRFCGSDPTKVDSFDSFNKENRASNLQVAFAKAQEHMQIPQLLEAEEVSEGDVDERSMLLYLSLFYHAFQAKESSAESEAERRAQLEREQALSASLESRAKLADELQAENAELRSKLEQMTVAFEKLKAENADMQDNNDVLLEKVNMLQKMLDEEAAAKEAAQRALEQANAEIEKLKRRVDQLEKELAASRGGNTELLEFKGELEGQIGTLEGQVGNLTGELAALRSERDAADKANNARNQTELRALAVLKKNILQHIEDLHRWQKYINVEGDVDFAGEVRPAIMTEITQKDFDGQLSDLSSKLASENGELEGVLRAKEAEKAAIEAKASAKGKGKAKPAESKASAADAKAKPKSTKKSKR